MKPFRSFFKNIQRENSRAIQELVSIYDCFYYTAGGVEFGVPIGSFSRPLVRSIQGSPSSLKLFKRSQVRQHVHWFEGDSIFGATSR